MPEISGAERLNPLSFPHIANNILYSLCDHDPLTALRLQMVCRDWHTRIKKWHTRIKKHLFTHIWISCGDFSPVRLTTSVDEFCIGTVRSLGRPSLQFTIPLADVIPYKREETVNSHPLVLAAVGAAQVIDARCNSSHLFLPYDLLRVPILHLYDRCPSIDAPLPDPETLVIVSYPYTPRFLSSILTTGAHTSKIVVHPPVWNFSLMLFFPNHGRLPKTVKSVPVFYPFYSHVNYADKSLDDLLNDGIPILKRDYSDGRKLTLVVPDTCSPTYQPLPSEFEASWKQLCHRLEKDAPQLLDNVEFLTTAAYRARVGDETYRLHACCDPPSGIRQSTQ